MRRRAFTLVELLIVIGIIAVLAGFLLTSGSRVRKQSAQLQCANNLRHLAMAFTMYAQDNEGRFPDPFKTFAPGLPPITKYLGRVDPATVAVCPADDVSQRPYKFSYSANVLIAPAVRLAAVQVPARKILLIDEDKPDDGEWHQDKQPDALALRHLNDRGNVAYCDGHVDAVTRKDTREPLNYDPKLQ